MTGGGSVERPSAPGLEPVPVPECRICFAADRGRKNTTHGTRAGFNRIITQHPHRRSTDTRAGL
ncbi:hypothetical protein AB852_35385 [Streptomyces uncialis]|uniref:Uncharacterized protein n=1 Tax=Streptomyces uncialis TaxID=1048205 RepID=A0A1Q4UXX6_9ACTN|nr:hypothetical protein AB852_35385 [Streptomyces uncialis]